MPSSRSNLPGARLLRLEPALELVRQSRHGALQGVELLVEIGPQALELGGLGQILGAGLLVEGGLEHRVGRIGLRHRRGGRGLQRGLALGRLRLLAGLHLGGVVGVDLGLAAVLLLLLGAVGRRLVVVLRVGLGALVLGAVLVGVGVLVAVVVLGVGIVAELVAVAEIRDDAPRQLGERDLVLQRGPEVLERRRGLALNELAPEPHHVVRPLGQVPARGEVAHEVSRGDGQRRLGRLRDLGVAAPLRLHADLGVDVARCARHVARADGLAARGLHRLVEVARHLARGLVARVGLGRMVAAAQRVGVGRAARQQHLLGLHAARHLRQAQAVGGHAGGVDGVGHAEIGVASQRARGLGQRLLERIGGVVLGHGSRSLLDGRRAARQALSHSRGGASIGWPEPPPPAPG